MYAVAVADIEHVGVAATALATAEMWVFAGSEAPETVEKQPVLNRLPQYVLGSCEEHSDACLLS